MVQLKVTTHVAGLDSDAVSGQRVLSGDAAIHRDIAIDAKATVQVELIYRVDDIKTGALFVQSNGDVIVHTNDADKPSDSFAVLKGQVIEVARLTADIESVFIENAGDKPVTVLLRGVRTSVK